VVQRHPHLLLRALHRDVHARHPPVAAAADDQGRGNSCNSEVAVALEQRRCQGTMLRSRVLGLAYMGRFSFRFRVK
jgi:hypothetical protein